MAPRTFWRRQDLTRAELRQQLHERCDAHGDDVLDVAAQLLQLRETLRALARVSPLFARERRDVLASLLLALCESTDDAADDPALCLPLLLQLRTLTALMLEREADCRSRELPPQRRCGRAFNAGFDGVPQQHWTPFELPFHIDDAVIAIPQR